MFNIKPLISVIITLYNYENFIPHCLKSVLNQNYSNLEIVVVDDASTDSSYKRAKAFEGDNVRVIRLNENRGYSAAKNEGIRASMGEYLVMLDADDMLMKQSIHKRMKALIENDVDFVYANAVVVKNNCTLQDCYKMTDHKEECFPTPYHIHAQTVLLKKQLHRDFGLYDETLRSRSDREMWWRFFGQSEADPMRVERFYLDKPVVYYRYHSAMMTRFRQKHRDYDKKVRSMAEEACQMRKKMGITKDNTLFLEDGK